MVNEAFYGLPRFNVVLRKNIKNSENNKSFAPFDNSVLCPISGKESRRIL